MAAGGATKEAVVAGGATRVGEVVMRVVAVVVTGAAVDATGVAEVVVVAIRGVVEAAVAATKGAVEVVAEAGVEEEVEVILAVDVAEGEAGEVR